MESYSTVDLSASDLDALGKLDTPTVCNALELVSPERQGSGYTVAPFVCPRPLSQPIVGYARTATIRSMQPPTDDPAAATAHRLSYYGHIAEGAGPTITVIQDLDPIPGYGAWWGEVNTSIHKGLGSLGVITNGSVRDLDDSAEGFALLAGCVGPSHAWVRVEDFSISVTVHGMTVKPGDLIHADQHGAVIVPPHVVTAIAKEKLLIDASNQPNFGVDKLRELLS